MLWFRPYPWSTTFALAGLAVLVSLGTWQLHRLEWKLDLIDRTQSRLSEAPVPLDEALLAADGNTGTLEYRRVLVEGQIAQTKELHLFRRNAGKPGYYVFVALHRDDGEVFLVSRGFLPLAQKADHVPTAVESNGLSQVSGVLQTYPKKALFVPENDVSANEWFYLTSEQVEDWVGAAPVLPVYIVSQEGLPGDVRLEAIELSVDLPNDHLGYAITWFGLALALAGVYVMYHVSEGRLKIGSRDQQG